MHYNARGSSSLHWQFLVKFVHRFALNAIKRIRLLKHSLAITILTFDLLSSLLQWRQSYRTTKATGEVAKKNSNHVKTRIGIIDDL